VAGDQNALRRTGTHNTINQCVRKTLLAPSSASACWTTPGALVAPERRRSTDASELWSHASAQKAQPVSSSMTCGFCEECAPRTQNDSRTTRGPKRQWNAAGNSHGLSDMRRPTSAERGRSMEPPHLNLLGQRTHRESAPMALDNVRRSSCRFRGTGTPLNPLNLPAVAAGRPPPGCDNLNACVARKGSANVLRFTCGAR
jgi:hypothetical protein